MKTAIKLFLLLSIGLLTNFQSQASQKYYSGTYQRNLTWSKDTADTIIVAHNMQINQNFKLMIEEDVVVLLQGRMTSYNIKAIGTSSAPIRILRSSSATFSSTIDVPQRSGLDSAVFAHVRFDTIRFSARANYHSFSNCAFYGNSNIETFDELWVDSSSFIGSNASRVLWSNSSMDIRNSIFRNNGVNSGSFNLNAVYVQGSAEIHNNQFISNQSNPIYIATLGQTNISNNTFTGSSSNFSPIHLDPSNSSGVAFLNILDNIIDSNQARMGGGMHFNTQVRGEIAFNTISRNKATLSGGGVHTTKPLEDFHSNLIVNNHAERDGGGINMNGSSGTCLIKSCIIANNSAQNGGGVYHNFVNARIINSTIVNNYDTLSAGAIRTRSGGSVQLDVINSIIYGNRSNSGQNQIDFISGTFNILHSTIEGGYTGLNNINQNPLFNNPSAGAGSHIDARNSDWSLDDCNSPAIDMGNKDTLISLSAGFYDYRSTNDFDGNNRITRAQIDMGAHESNGINRLDAWMNNTLCSNDSLVSLKAVFGSNGSSTNTVWQIDTGNGIWSTIIPVLLPGISFSGDTLVANNVHLTLANSSFRAIGNFGCYSDTSKSWSPPITPISFGSTTVEICSKDSANVFGVWQKQAGVYVDTLVNQAGCDSIFSTTLIVYPSYTIDVYDTICQGESINWNGQTYTTPGDYQASFNTSSPLACDSTIILHLAQHPALFTSLSDTTYGCLGDTITFDLSSPNLSSYRWSEDGTSFDSSAQFSIVPTNFWERVFVTVTDINDCEINATRDFLKVELESYVIQADPSLSPFIEFSFAIGPPANAKSYYWEFGDGDTSSQATVLHEYKSNSTFNYCMKVNYECGLDASCNDIDILNVGNSEPMLLDGIQLYPNPANDELNISIGYEYKNLSIEIFDNRASLVKRIDNQNAAINVGDLAPGLYLVTIKADERTKQLKIIVE